MAIRTRSPHASLLTLFVDFTLRRPLSLFIAPSSRNKFCTSCKPLSSRPVSEHEKIPSEDRIFSWRTERDSFLLRKKPGRYTQHAPNSRMLSASLSRALRVPAHIYSIEKALAEANAFSMAD